MQIQLKNSKYEQVLDFAKFLTDEFKKPIEVKRNRFPLDLTFAVYNLDLETFTTEDPEDIYNSLVKLNDKVQGSHISNVEVYSLAIERFVSSEKVLEQDLGYAIENNEFEMPKFKKPFYKDARFLFKRFSFIFLVLFIIFLIIVSPNKSHAKSFL